MSYRLSLYCHSLSVSVRSYSQKFFHGPAGVCRNNLVVVVEPGREIIVISVAELARRLIIINSLGNYLKVEFNFFVTGLIIDLIFVHSLMGYIN